MRGLYRRMAWDSIRNNAKLYVPSILAGAGLQAIYYIMFTLARDERMKSLKGGSFLPIFMSIGLVVVTILTVILVFYINSFIMKRRKHEYGLYNVLGLEKRHIGRVMYWENGILDLSSIVLGTVFGIAFYKLCSLFICNLLRVSSPLGFDFIRLETIVPIMLFFAGLYILTIIYDRIIIARMKPIDLVNAKHTGEKEPKVKWLIFLLGLATLGTGYYIALTTANPLKAINSFFIAVPAVVVGTYFLFVAGSIVILKALKKNKKYYYHKTHMITVSGLLYRMKQNAVGLASITILATSVIIMVSTTISLYAGVDDTIKKMYNHDAYVMTTVEEEKDDETVEIRQLTEDELKNILEPAAKDAGASVKYTGSQRFLETECIYVDGTYDVSSTAAQEAYASGKGSLGVILYMTEADYNDSTGSKLGLKDGEIALCDIQIQNNYYDVGETIRLSDMDFTVKEKLKTYPIQTQYGAIVQFSYGVVVNDEETLKAVDKYYREKNNIGKSTVILQRVVADFNEADVDYKKLEEAFCNRYKAYVKNKYGENMNHGYGFDTRWAMKDELFGMYGSFVFLGFILSIAFLFATALIIYYKQLSEGYEDRERFQIMQKVGLSQKEVKKSIRYQILIVFFLPIIVSAVHVAVAFPILTKLLAILFLSSKTLFLICVLIAFAVFALIYIIIYSITARMYYHIVR